MVGGRIARVRDKIKNACVRAGRDPLQITLVGVTKGRTIDLINKVIETGIIDIGENRVQEAFLKFNVYRSAYGAGDGIPGSQPDARAPAVRWHMIGHLQTNKVKEAVRIFDLIHSVDSVRLAKEISAQAAACNKVQDILLEIKTSTEATKYGIEPGQAEAVAKEIAALPNIRLQGLMTIAALGKSAEEARQSFRQLRQLLAQLNAQRPPQDAIHILSMGMSDDFEVAIEEGATMVRIGRALFQSN